MSLRTVQAFEKGGRAPIANNIAAMRRAIETEGIRLLFDEAGEPAGIMRNEARVNLS